MKGSFKLVLIVMLLALFFLPGIIVAQDPLRSPEVYSLFLDWLSGKSMGLATLKVVPVDENGNIVVDNFVFYLHNFTSYTSKLRSERIYEGSSQNIVVKLWRLLDRFNKWQEQEFTVVVVSKNYFGTKLIKIVPEKPLLSLEEKVVVSGIKKQEKFGFSNGKTKSLIQGPPSSYEVQTSTELTNAVQLHTIQGVTARVVFSSGNYLYFSQKSRLIGWDPASDSIVVESDWQISGAKDTPCLNDLATASISNGDKRWIKVCVNYKYERWPATGALPYNYYEIETPVDFGGGSFGDSISCSYCGGKPSGQLFGYPQGTPTPFSISLGPGIQQIETTGAKVTFSVSYGYVAVTVELWKEISNGTNTTPPKIEVTNVNWQANNLYAFDAGSDWKILHFTWNPP
ncbi:MAG: hypothetical protein QW314_04625 [Thermoproteota archaeon]